MKKLLTILFALSLFCTSAFTKENYKGDVQLHFGVDFDFTQFNVQNLITDNNSFIINADVSTTHLWGSNPVLKFGFMVDYYLGFGSSTKNSAYTSDDKASISFNTGMFVGPCFGFNFGNALRLDLTPGISLVALNLDSYHNSVLSEYRFTGTTAAGIGLDLKAKFTPNSAVSPVIGYRYTANFATAFFQYTYDGSSSNAATLISAKEVILQQHYIYAGISWNW